MQRKTGANRANIFKPRYLLDDESIPFMVGREQGGESQSG